MFEFHQHSVCMISTICVVEKFRFLLLFVGFCWLQRSASLGHRQQSFLVWCVQSQSSLCWTAAIYACCFSWSKTVSTSPQSEYKNACPLDLCAWRQHILSQYSERKTEGPRKIFQETFERSCSARIAKNSLGSGLFRIKIFAVVIARCYVCSSQCWKFFAVHFCSFSYSLCKPSNYWKPSGV